MILYASTDTLVSFLLTFPFAKSANCEVYHEVKSKITQGFVNQTYWIKDMGLDFNMRQNFMGVRFFLTI